MSEMSLVMLDLTNANLDQTMDVDEYRDYIHIGLKNIIRTYTNNSEGIIENEIINEYELTKCDESYYKTDFEQKYY